MLVAGGIAVAAGVAGGAAWLWPQGGPEVAADVRERVTPVVRAHLEERGIVGGVLEETPGARVLCSVRLIEARERAGFTRAGVHAHCEEFAPRGAGLARGTGVATPLVAHVRDGEVVRVEEAEDGAGHAASVRAMFTGAGADAALRDPGHPALDARARTAFGLPSSAPIDAG